MPPIKHRTSKKFPFRDFWGDATQGELFDEMIDRKFGDYFGSRKKAVISLLGRENRRRLLDMYCTGERAIPNELWAALNDMPDYDDVDPLS